MRNVTKIQSLSSEGILRYAAYLRDQERSRPTIEKYLRDLRALGGYLEGRTLTKSEMIGWKEHLSDRYAPATVNSMLAAANGYLAFAGMGDRRVRLLRIQRELFARPERELNRGEYHRLVTAADKKGDRRLALILQTICATGIRVSELQYITVEAARTGYARVDCKGKRRTVFLPQKLRQLLIRYLKNQKKTAGAVFTTRTGRPVNRSNIWREMKELCGAAGVQPEKVFPHNLRHLFARTYYLLEKDLSRLADILGHSSVSTTRIYTAESGVVHARQMERMGLVVT